MDRDYQTYYRFQIDHRGALAEDCWGDKTWNPKYHVAFNATDTGWTAEIAIPLVELTGDRPAHGKSWDFSIFGIVRFFQLAMENNPNVIDSLFTPRRCVLSSTAIGEYIREHRVDFLHKGAWHRSGIADVRARSKTGRSPRAGNRGSARATAGERELWAPDGGRFHFSRDA